MKNKYRELCQIEPSIPIFSQSWWLDAVCGENNWDVCIVLKNNELHASLPFQIKNKYNLKILGQPKLTQKLGPWIRKNESSTAKKISVEKDIMNSLIEQLPKFDYFHQKWDSEYKNWLPFYWAGYKQTSNVTYKLKDISDEEKIWNGFQGNIRKEVRKAQKSNLEIVVNDNLEDFIKLNVKVFRRQHKKLPYDEALVRSIYNSCAKRNCVKIFTARDCNGNNHAGVFIIWDEKSAYYLMGGGDPDLRTSGATSLCMWEAIKFSSTKTKSFDFEGSMIEPIERYFRAFGAEQVFYSSVYKSNSLIIDMINKFKKK